MTTDEIVKRLRDTAERPDCTYPAPMLEAADLLEALEAGFSDAEVCIKKLQAENKRLREAYVYTDGAFWFLVFDGRQLGPFAERDDARAALRGET